MDEKVTEDVWDETPHVLALACERWTSIWSGANEFGFGKGELPPPEALARMWANKWGVQTIRILAFSEDEKEKRERYRLAQAAKYVYAIRYLSERGAKAVYDYLWWCEQLFPISLRYREHIEKKKKK